MLEFTDVIDDGSAEAPVEYSSLGVVLFTPDGDWTAVHPDVEAPTSGIGPLTGLPRSLWLCNLSYEEAKGVSEASRGITLRSDQWLRISLDQILSEVNLAEADETRKAKMVSEIANRVFKLAQEVLFLSIPDERQLAMRTLRRMRLGPSLATGLMFIHENELSGTRPAERGVQDAFRRTLRGAMTFGAKDPASEDLRLNFRFPRLSYALEITKNDIPDGEGRWRQARRPDDLSSDEFIKTVIEQKQPAIFRALCSQKGLVDPMVPEVFLNGGGRGETRRSHFIDDELDFLHKHFKIDFDGVLMGEGWKPSLTHKLLEGLVATCSSSDAASCSVSAGILAENILASSMRRKRGDPETPAGEALWVSMRDRIAMAPAVMALMEAGASPAVAYLGNIAVEVPPDPELLQSVVQVGWEAGLTLPMSDVQQLEEYGVSPPCDMESFGGFPVDYPLSAVAHQGQRKVVLAMDRVMSLSFEERVKTFERAFRE